MPPKWIDLKDGEEVRLKTHPSLWLLFREFVYVVIAAAIAAGIFVSGVIPDTEVAGVSADLLVFAIVPIAAIPLVRELILRQFISYWITDTRLYKKEGIISREVDPFKIDKIVDIDVSEGKLDRLVGKGDVSIANAADSEYDMIWESVPNPHKIHSKIEDAQQDLEASS